MPNRDGKRDLIQLIKDKGFNPVLTPRDTINPLDLIVRKDKGVIAWFKDLFGETELTQTGDALHDVIKGNSSFEVETTNMTSEISGAQSSNVDVSAELALQFLKILESNPSDKELETIFEVARKSMSQASFKIDGETIKRSVPWSQIDSYLSNAKIKDNLPTLEEMILNNQVYIITATLSSNSFTFNEEGSSTTLVDVTLPEIKALFKGKLKGEIGASDASGIKYKGDKQMIFGIEAVRLIAEKEGDTVSFRIKEEDKITVRGEERFEVERQLKSKDHFLEIE